MIKNFLKNKQKNKRVCTNEDMRLLMMKMKMKMKKSDIDMTYTDLGLDMDTNIVNIKSVKYKIFDVLMYQATANQHLQLNA